MSGQTESAARPGWVIWVGLAVVAAASAVLSFATVRDLAASAGYPDRLAWLLPVVIDATAVVGSRIWLGAVGNSGAVGYARSLALAAAVVTVGANVLQHGLVAHRQLPPWGLVAALAAIPPIALVAVAHQVALLSRSYSVDAPEPGAQSAEQPPPEAGTEQALPSGAPEELTERAREVVATAEGPIGRRKLARELDITEHHARQLLAQVTGAPGDRSDGSVNGSTPAMFEITNGARHV